MSLVFFFSKTCSFYFFSPHLRICLLVLGQEGGRERHRLVASHMRPDQGLTPQHFGGWDDTPTNWPTCPGQFCVFWIRPHHSLFASLLSSTITYPRPILSFPSLNPVGISFGDLVSSIGQQYSESKSRGLVLSVRVTTVSLLWVISADKIRKRLYIIFYYDYDHPSIFLSNLSPILKSISSQR